ncbi:hypothetical protein [Roseibacillus ishigakijimensis]|uniref:Uncharacterized protein n=1 Tax=Roseibacillus ishigakijimensis TaxID=454146 RepID=A0A934RQP6_9BACT|nr:hypothetical protein [Roseibacillus ishigakijimensis]MBK1835163.1 hypothetical protein [Roseibacillus ishigakijimensis]
MKSKAAEGLEPADVDPAQLRRTAFALLGIILIGAIAILWSYNLTASKQKEDFRPAFMDELTGHILLQRADGTVVNTADIEEDVWLYYQTSFADRDNHPEREKALALLPEEGIRRVEFFVDMDPNDEADRAQMATLEEKPHTWRVAAKAKVLEKYLKSEIRFGTIPHERDGQLIYDSSVAVLKRDRPEGKNPRIHMRGEMFDFARAAREAEKAGKPELAVGYREDYFLRTINHLLAEGDPTEKK